MSRTFQDKNLLVWDAFASTGKQGFSSDPHIVFNCSSVPQSRPRWIKVSGDEADAQAMLIRASNDDIVSLFERSQELP